MPDGFFQTHAKLTAKAVEAALGSTPSTSSGPAGSPLTVTQLTQRIDRAIKEKLNGPLLVKGEISNYRAQKAGSGHLYFTLKDATACIDCVMWRDDAMRLKFNPSDGLEAIAGGRVSVYADRGKYQLYVNTLSPLGKGALELAFQQLRAKLEKEGLFAAERKKSIPTYPLNVALVTSSATAALQDMLKVLKRFAWLRLSLYHVPVQGEAAAGKIAAALRWLNERSERADVILLGRGGGSLEDLWPFNEEIVARAIAAGRIPIVTGIGHEVDVSIADLVADHHAHTPTEAAQVITARWRTVADELEISGTRLRRAVRQMVSDARQRLLAVERHEVFRRPLDRINVLRQLLDDRQKSLGISVSTLIRHRLAALTALDSRLAQRHPRHQIALQAAKIAAYETSLRRTITDVFRRRVTRMDALEAHLHAVGPQEVLRRGYTITMRKKDGLPLRRAVDAKVGETLVTLFADGKVESTVEDAKQPKLF
jgi:exodeoxyribonuclease VII large subunit